MPELADRGRVARCERGRVPRRLCEPAAFGDDGRAFDNSRPIAPALRQEPLAKIKSSRLIKLGGCIGHGQCVRLFAELCTEAAPKNSIF